MEFIYSVGLRSHLDTCLKEQEGQTQLAHFILSLIHPFDKDFSSPCCVPGTPLGAGDTAVDKVPVLMEICSRGEDRQKTEG